MAASGNPFEAPRACPFVALELDRDRRAEKPDYRHRCFAEPTPAPRSIAHQEAYCLSPNFPACPVFQDWAVRAAARPVGGSSASSGSGPAVVGGAAAGAAAGTAPGGTPSSYAAPAAVPARDAENVASADAASNAADPSRPTDASSTAGASPVPDASPAPGYPPPSRLAPEDISMSPATATAAAAAAAAAAATGVAPGTVSAPTFATTGWDDAAADNQQLAAFDAPTSDAQPTRPTAEPATFGNVAASTDSPSRATEATATGMPAFLAGRSSRPTSPPAAMPDSSPTANSAGPADPIPVRRDDIVPSWHIDGRYGADTSDDTGGSRFDGILTAIAVIAILALGVAAVLFLPGMLSHGGAARTPGPSFVAASIPVGAGSSVLPTTAPASLASISPSFAPATSALTPSAPLGSPLAYKIKPGDTLAAIAAKFGVAVADILGANPDISDANSIQAGEIIAIPTAAAAPSPGATP